MGLLDHKIENTDITTFGVVAAPDRLTGTAEENKKIFDRLIRESVKGDFNAIIDLLVAVTAASELGFQSVEGLDADTIQKAIDIIHERENELREEYDGMIDRVTELANSAEAWANGKIEGEPVPEGHDAYENNAKFYSEKASDSADAAATSETNAATSEANASTSETNAGNSEAAAAESATAAAASQAAAAASATSAEASNQNAIGMANALGAFVTPYSSSKTYSVGEFVKYNELIYKCKTAITTPESWNIAHWTEIAIGNDISKLFELINNTLSIIPITRKGGYITFANQTVDITQFISNASYNCYVVPCSEGDVFTVSALGTAVNARPYGFIGSNGEKIEVATNIETINNLVLTAPEDSAYLVINDKGNNISFYGSNELILKPSGILNSSHFNAGVTLDDLQNGIWQIGISYFQNDDIDNPITKMPSECIRQLVGCVLISYSMSDTAKWQIIFCEVLASAFIRRRISSGWTAWSQISGIGQLGSNGFTDFNQMTMPGWRYVTQNQILTMENAPSIPDYIICITFATKAIGDGTIVQIAYGVRSAGVQIRRRVSNVWENWVALGLSYIGIDSDENIDNIKKSGTYYVKPSNNAPNKFAGPMVVISPDNDSDIVSQIIFDTRDGKIYERKILNGEWLSWNIISTDKSGVYWPYDFDTDTVDDTWEAEWEAQLHPEKSGRSNIIVSNTGTQLKIATYNLAAYSRLTASGDRETYIYDLPEKLLNLRRWFSQENLDVLFSNEDSTYIDASGTKSASKYIYYDRLPAKSGVLASKVRSKRPIIISKDIYVESIMENVKDSEGEDVANIPPRGISMGLMQIDEKSVLLISCHPRNTSSYYFDENPVNGPIADRKNNLQIIFDLVYCIKHHEITEGILDIPEWDYVIIGGDFNTSNINGRSTAQGHAYYYSGTSDYDNLSELRDYYAFDSVNGGYLNWFSTHDSLKCLDNILTSGNIIINSIECNYDDLRKLYSDHIPISADVTLLSEEDNPGIELTRFPAVTYEGKSVDTDLSELREWFAQIITGTIKYPV